MTKRTDNTLSEKLESIRLGWKLIFGLTVGSAFMAVGSLYSIAAMAIARRPGVRARTLLG